VLRTRRPPAKCIESNSDPSECGQFVTNLDQLGADFQGSMGTTAAAPLNGRDLGRGQQWCVPLQSARSCSSERYGHGCGVAVKSNGTTIKSTG
jgi:hypothetical protein